MPRPPAEEKVDLPPSRGVGGDGVRSRSWRWYHTKAGGTPARDDLQRLPPDARAAVAEAMARNKRGEQRPYEDEQINRDLRAVRVFHDGNTYRMIYAREGEHDTILLALHCFQKKDRKLPVRERRVAEKRLKDWRQRGAS